MYLLHAFSLKHVARPPADQQRWWLRQRRGETFHTFSLAGTRARANNSVAASELHVACCRVHVLMLGLASRFLQGGEK